MDNAMKMMFAWVAIERNDPMSGQMVPSHGSFSELPELGNYRLAQEGILCTVIHCPCAATGAQQDGGDEDDRIEIDKVKTFNFWQSYIYLGDARMQIDDLDDEDDENYGLMQRSGMFQTREHAMTFCDVQLKLLGYREFESRHLNFL